MKKKKKKNKKYNKAVIEKKKSKSLISVAIAAAIVLVVALVCGKTGNDTIADPDYEPQIKEIVYYYKNQEINSFCRMTLSEGQLTIKKSEGNGIEAVTNTCDVENTIYEDLDETIEKYDIRSWTNLAQKSSEENTEIISLEITFTDGQVIDVDNSTELPDNAERAIEEIKNILETSMEY